MTLLRLLVLLLLSIPLGSGMLVAQTFQPAPPAPVDPVPGTYTYYGTGCTLNFNPPRPEWASQLTAVGRPVLGGRVEVFHRIPQPPWWWGVAYMQLLTGLSATSVHGLPLPLDLSLYGYARGCFLYTSAEIVQWDQSRGFIEFRIPNDRNLLGLTLYQQWHVYIRDTRIPHPMWPQFSNGGMMVIGR